MDLLADPRVTGDFRTEPGTLSLGEAWRKVLGTADLVARFEDGRVLVFKAARDGGSPRSPRVATGFNCRTH
jgi:hypothetical protein